MSASRPRLRDRGLVRSAIAKLVKFRESLTIRLKKLKIVIIDLPFFVWDETVSAFYVLASCNCRRCGGRIHHLCGSREAMCRHHRLRMTGQIGLRHRASRGTDTWHTSTYSILTTFSSRGLTEINLGR